MGGICAGSCWVGDVPPFNQVKFVKLLTFRQENSGFCDFSAVHFRWIGYWSGQ